MGEAALPERLLSAQDGRRHVYQRAEAATVHGGARQPAPDDLWPAGEEVETDPEQEVQVLRQPGTVLSARVSLVYHR